MTFAGVPVLDWVLFVVLIGFGIEAYATTRSSSPTERSERKAHQEDRAEINRDIEAGN